MPFNINIRLVRGHKKGRNRDFQLFMLNVTGGMKNGQARNRSVGDTYDTFMCICLQVQLVDNEWNLC